MVERSIVGGVMPRGQPCLKGKRLTSVQLQVQRLRRQKIFIGASTRSPGRSGSISPFFPGNDEGCEERG